jgi:uncharacterized membrane protein
MVRYGFQKVIDPKTQECFWAYFHPNYFQLPYTGHGGWVYDDCETYTVFRLLKPLGVPDAPAV